MAALYANDKSLDSDMLVFDGGAIKALGNGRIGGYGILFTTANDPDLQGDFFTKSTDFDLETRNAISTLWYHGTDPAVKGRKLGQATFRVDDVGVWFESKLQERDEYEKAIYKLAELGKLGWSTGSAPHLVKRKQTGKSFEVEAWPIVELSYTHVPVEARTSAVALKSLDTVPFTEAVRTLEEEEREFSLAGLPALAKVVAPTDLKGMTERSESVETAVKEFITYGQVVGDVLKSHVARVENKVEFRFLKDGRLPASNIQHVESMLRDLGRLKTGFTAIESDLERLQKLSTAVKSKQSAMDEHARFELWNFLRISGKSPEEFKNGNGTG